MPGALHFVTGNTLNRKPLFKNDDYCRALLGEIQRLRTIGQFKLVALVIMFDHFHLIINPPDGDIQAAMRDLKSFAAKAIISASNEGLGDQIWQEGFKAVPLWSDWMIRQKINYIHANPVRAALCDTAEDYPWSSFRYFYREEVDPLLQVDSEWWWPGDQERVIPEVRKWEAERVGRLEAQIEKNRAKLRGGRPPS